MVNCFKCNKLYKGNRNLPKILVHPDVITKLANLKGKPVNNKGLVSAYICNDCLSSLVKDNQFLVGSLCGEFTLELKQPPQPKTDEK